jgi:hypothetical protein
MDANYRTAKSSTNGPNNFSKLLKPTYSPLELYFPSALDSHHYHFTYNMTTVPKPSGTNSPSPNGTTNATLILSPTNHKTNDSTNYQKHIDQTTQFMREKAQFMREKACRSNNSIHEGESSVMKKKIIHKENIQGTHEGAKQRTRATIVKGQVLFRNKHIARIHQ